MDRSRQPRRARASEGTRKEARLACVERRGDVRSILVFVFLRFLHLPSLSFAQLASARRHTKHTHQPTMVYHPTPTPTQTPNTQWMKGMPHLPLYLLYLWLLHTHTRDACSLHFCPCASFQAATLGCAATVASTAWICGWVVRFWWGCECVYMTLKRHRNRDLRGAPTYLGEAIQDGGRDVVHEAARQPREGAVRLPRRVMGTTICVCIHECECEP